MSERRPFTAQEAAQINQLAEADRAPPPAKWLQQRAASILTTSAIQTKPWGWKEPNTHIVIDRLMPLIPNLKYIHVMRNGLDMAYSGNQNQPKYWGPHFLGTEYDATPRYSLHYWHTVHQRILDLAAIFGNRFYLLNYDAFCLDTSNAIRQLLEFLALDLSADQISSLCRLVQPPASIGRFKHHSPEAFNPADVAFVQSLGFDVSYPS